MSKNRHAELILEYAKDWAETDTPWMRWEYRGDEEFSNWTPCWEHPKWHDRTDYRRKQETILINGHEVPKPFSGKLNEGDEYYVAGTSSRGCQGPLEWENEELENFWLERGLIHLDEQSAELHVMALLSFTETKDKP